MSRHKLSVLRDHAQGRPLFPKAIRYPGLTAGLRDLEKLCKDLPKAVSVHVIKQQAALLWIIFMGGTGTGKSTLFNAFCGKSISATGVERPKTHGPIVYSHRSVRLPELLFPLSVSFGPGSGSGSREHPSAGAPGQLTLIEHGDERFRHYVLVDTPDLDSVAEENRQAARDLYLLADVVIFVTSQEKYADDVPYRFLLRILKEKARYFFIVNKIHSQMTAQEVIETLQGQGGAPEPERVWLIPMAPYNPADWIAQHPAFRDLIKTLAKEIPPDTVARTHRSHSNQRSAELRKQMAKLRKLLEGEVEASETWKDQLEQLYRQSSRSLVQEESDHFSAASRKYLQTEIRNLFSRYDVLAKPRRAVREIVLAPLRLLGIIGPSPENSSYATLLKLRDRIDLAPIRSSVTAFNHRVLKELSPDSADAPLFGAMRETAIPITEAEARERIYTEQERLARWLEQTFQELAKGIPKGKELGIYSTSILWGIMILAFETAVGGGFTMIDAVLDSALAPFVTKGAVELFAYQEIQKVANELGQRYEDALLSVLREQKERYVRCLEDLVPTRETLEQVRSLESRLAD